MKLRTISDVCTIYNDKADDLFICCASFEHRCTYAPQQMRNNYKAKYAIIVKFRKEFEEDILKNLKLHCLNHFTTYEIKEIELDLYDVISFWYVFKKFFSNISDVHTITIDISTFTKASFLVLLKVLRKLYKNAIIRTLYTKAQYPKINKNSNLSWGVQDVMLLPYFGFIGNSRVEKSVLLLFLGYEAQRAYSVWNYIQPSVTISIVGQPTETVNKNLPAIKVNKFLLDHNKNSIYHISHFNPNESYNLITTLFNKDEFKDYIFYISPLGSKMQTIGIFQFFENNEHIQAKIVYSSPALYNEKKYTVGYERNKIWEYYLPITKNINV